MVGRGGTTQRLASVLVGAALVLVAGGGDGMDSIASAELRDPR